MTQPVRAAYDAELAARGYVSDPAQLCAVEALERCASEWAEFKEQRSNAFKKLINRPDIPRGVYMHGGVGRGKSFLMDCFYTAVPIVRKTRLHFHEFMREVHRELAELKGRPDPLDELGERMARRYRLICFDEFHVADITDAMILHRLLDSLFEHRELKAKRKAGGVVWFTFKELCGGPRSQNDYLELATQFHTLLLSDVPQMSPRLASEARRFTLLVDVLYDRRVKLVLSAEVPAEALYTDGPLAHEFPRTISRLHEMQSAEFVALPRRDVNTLLT